MGINVGILKKALSDLPAPEYEGEILQFDVPSRVYELQQKLPLSNEGRHPPVEPEFHRFVVCVSRRYFNSDVGEWFEWELDL